ncbi:MAG: hypothetical protein CMF62_01565 [Magnetococcales bacterium]|nr:hypothetical protein [Magnetococcales bacterium]|tara:strand:- start:44509 stop:44745 length:237 start_codon:yes stop_codon:yes gene_type:complete
MISSDISFDIDDSYDTNKIFDKKQKKYVIIKLNTIKEYGDGYIKYSLNEVRKNNYGNIYYYSRVMVIPHNNIKNLDIR